MTESKEEITKKIHEKYPVTRNMKNTAEARMQWEAMERSMDAILVEDYDRHPTISEGDFVNYLLPKLQELGPDTDLSIWIKMAGSYDRPIRVVGQDQTELFLIPPIYGSVRTTIAASGMTSISQSVEDMRMHMDNIPVYGEQILNKKIRPKIKEVPISEEYMQTWYKIAKRYGLEVKEREDVDTPARKAAIFEDEEDL